MPLTDEQKAIGFAVGMPGLAALVGTAAHLSDKSSFEWFKGLKRPNWGIPPEKWIAAHAVMDTVTIAPLVYATVQVIKKGGFDSCDVKKAMVSYGAGTAFAIMSAICVKQKCLKCFSFSMAALFANSVLTHHLYYNIDKKAGYLVLPAVALYGYSALLIYRMYTMNEDKKVA